MKNWKKFKVNKVKKTTNGKGNLLECRKYNNKNNLLDVYKYEYDKRNNLILEKRYNKNEKLRCYIEYIYNQENNLLKRTMFSPEGKLEYEKKYIHKNNKIVKEKGYNYGKILRYKKEYFYDSDGYKIIEHCFNSKNELVNIRFFDRDSELFEAISFGKDKTVKISKLSKSKNKKDNNILIKKYKFSEFGLDNEYKE